MDLALETYVPQPAALRPWDPRLPGLAAALIERVRAVAGLAPEHIGSSSIPGMPGKGYVDLEMLAAPDRIPDLTERLVADGWQRQTGAHAFPATRPLLMAYAVAGDLVVPSHLHVVPTAKELARDVAFRDALRESAELRARYEARKREVLAQGIVYGPDYADAKSDVILAILDELSRRCRSSA